MKARLWEHSPHISKLEEWALAEEAQPSTEKYEPLTVILDMVQATNNNSKNNEDKADYISISWGLLIFGLACLVLYVLIFIFVGNDQTNNISITINGNVSSVSKLISELISQITPDFLI